MNKKPIRLSPKKGGNGYVTSYTINIGSAEAKACGFVNVDGSFAPLEKVIDPESGCIIIRIIEEEFL